MASKDSNPLPTKSQTMSPVTKENITNTSITPSKTAPSTDQGLADLPTSPMKEAKKKQEVLQKAQLESKGAVKETKEKTPPSPTTHMHCYAVEVWIKAETSPGNFTPPKEELYSADFVLNTLNLTYPGCTRVFPAEPGHAIAFYGHKGSVRVGLTVEQSTEACKLISSIPIWMGYAAKIKARAISLQEANDMIVGLKRLDKEDLKKACMELYHQLSSWRLGNTGSNLSATAQTFVPLATSSTTGITPLGAASVPVQVPPLPPADPVTHPLYTSEDKGATTEAVTPKKKNRKRGSRGKQRKRGSQNETCDSGLETASLSSSTRVSDSSTGWKHNKKKGGVNNKVHIPKFDGKTSNTEGVGEAFHRWSRSISYYRDYDEDEYLMAQIIGALKGDVTDMFDFACHHGKKHTKDQGLILEQMWHHYCGTLTFQEQQNTVENMRQKSHESAADFLGRVSGAVDGLARDWKGMVSQHEIKALLSEVFINGVQEEFRHILNSEMARYGELTKEQMYNAVKSHEVYLGRTKCLGGGGSTSTTPQKSTTPWASNITFKPRFQKTTAFVAAPMEESDSTPVDSGFDTSEESTSNADPTSDDLSGLYIPDFLGEANDREWGLMIRMAKAIQADEQQQKCCFICQSPDHFTRNCPQAKNVRRPLQPRGPPKTTTAAKAKEQAQTSLPAPLASPPKEKAQ